MSSQEIDIEKSPNSSAETTETPVTGVNKATAPSDSATNSHDDRNIQATYLQSLIETLKKPWFTAHAEAGNLRVRSLDEFGWGYPRQATFHSSDELFGLYRRFGYLQSRLLLEKQDSLRELENKLNDFDEEDRATSNTRQSDVHPSPREQLLEEIERAFNSYATLLASCQHLTASNRPSESEYRSVRDYIEENPALVPEEIEYIQHKEDLITLRPGRDHAWLDRSIEHALRRMPVRFMRRLFCSPETRLKYSQPDNEDNKGQVIYFTRERIDLCASAIITVMILGLLIVPIYLLYNVVKDKAGNLDAHSTGICIGVLLVSTLLFSAVLSLFTRAKRHEILGAAAAYCAVLVVFLGNVPD